MINPNFSNPDLFGGDSSTFVKMLEVELLNPLWNIQLTMELIDQEKEEANFPIYLDIIKRNSNRISAILRDFKTFNLIYC